MGELENNACFDPFASRSHGKPQAGTLKKHVWLNHLVGMLFLNAFYALLGRPEVDFSVANDSLMNFLFSSTAHGSLTQR